MNDFFKVNIGQVATLVVFLAGTLGVWYRMRFQLEELDEKVKTQSVIVREFEAKGVLLVLGQHEARLTKLEALQATLNAMQIDIAVIKTAVNRQNPNANVLQT